jgi:hypothetical protein
VEVFGARRVVSVWNLSGAVALEGQVKPRFEVITLGGEVGDVQQWVPHEARLKDAECHLLFLRPGPLGALWVTGMQQGAYSLPTSAEERVVLTKEQSEIAKEPHSACARFEGCSLTEVGELLASIVRS